MRWILPANATYQCDAQSVIGILVPDSFCDILEYFIPNSGVLEAKHQQRNFAFACLEA